MGKNKKTKNSGVKAVGSTAIIEAKPVYTPTPGITDGKADEEIAAAFRSVGFALANGTEVSEDEWNLLVPGMKNHYRDRYQIRM